jgi:hypothetical protein
MKSLKLIFAIEGLPARQLRQLHEELTHKLHFCKVIERVTDVAFSNLDNFDIAVLWMPKDRERAESFIRNVQLRKKLPIYIFCLKGELEGITEFSSYEHVKRIEVKKASDLAEIATSMHKELKSDLETAATESGQQAQALTICQIKELIDAAIGSISSKKDSQKIMIQRRGEETGTIFCQREEISQVLKNLLAHVMGSVSTVQEKLIDFETETTETQVFIRIYNASSAEKPCVVLTLPRQSHGLESNYVA